MYDRLLVNVLILDEVMGLDVGIRVGVMGLGWWVWNLGKEGWGWGELDWGWWGWDLGDGVDAVGLIGLGSGVMELRLGFGMMGLGLELGWWGWGDGAGVEVGVMGWRFVALCLRVTLHAPKHCTLFSYTSTVQSMLFLTAYDILFQQHPTGTWKQYRIWASEPRSAGLSYTSANCVSDENRDTDIQGIVRRGRGLRLDRLFLSLAVWVLVYFH